MDVKALEHLVQTTYKSSITAKRTVRHSSVKYKYMGRMGETSDLPFTLKYTSAIVVLCEISQQLSNGLP